MEKYKLFIKGESDTTYILTHGIGGDWRCWQNMVKAIPEGRIFVLNLPGFGGTKPLKKLDQISFNRYINNFINLVAKPEGKLYLFGHSLGSILLAGGVNDLKLQKDLKSRTKLVLFHFPYANKWMSFGARNIAKAIQVLNVELLSGMVSGFDQKNKTYIQLYDLYKKLVDHYVEKIDETYGEGEFLDEFLKMNIKAGKDGIDILNTFDCVPALEQAQLPITIIQGNRDHSIEPKMCYEILRNPNITQTWEPEFNHGSYIFESEKCLKLAGILC